MEIKESTSKVIVQLLKDFSSIHTITSLAKELKMSRVGIWKALKKPQLQQLIRLTPTGKGKTNTYIIDLNWDNILIEKLLALNLTEEAIRQRRWIVNFAELEKTVDFLILYGSILHSPKKAKDIDIIGIISKKKGFIELQNKIDKAQKSQSKKIHAINFTENEFKQELIKPNKAIVDAVKKGVILFGQEKFVRFMKTKIHP